MNFSDKRMTTALLVAALAMVPLGGCFIDNPTHGQLIFWNFVKGLSGAYTTTSQPFGTKGQTPNQSEFRIAPSFRPRFSAGQRIPAAAPQVDDPLATVTLSVRTGTSAGSRYSTSVYLLDDLALYQMDPATSQILRSLNLTAGEPRRLAVTSDNQFAVVTNSSLPNQPYVLIVNLTSFTIAAKITIPENANAYGVAITPDDQFAYVVTQSLATALDSVYVLDLNAKNVVANIPLPKYSSLQNIVMTPDGSEAYLNSGVGTDFQIPLISTATNTVVTDVSTIFFSAATGTLELTAPCYLAMHPDGTRVYLAPIDGSPIFVLDTATNLVTHMIQIPKGTASPAGTAPVFTPTGRYLIVLDGPSAFSVIDTHTDTLFTTVPVDPGIANGAPGGTKVGFYFVPGG